MPSMGGYPSAILKARVPHEELLRAIRRSGGIEVRRAYKKEIAEAPVSEMAIVNAFTKLIFGDEAYTAHELSIIAAFRAMDDSVGRDSHKEIGDYLRNLGVREMIQLVSGLRQYLAEYLPSIGSKSRHARGNPLPARGRDTP